MTPPSMLPWNAALRPRLLEAVQRIADLHDVMGRALRADEFGRVESDVTVLEAARERFSEHGQVDEVLRKHVAALLADGVAYIPFAESSQGQPVPWATIEYFLGTGSELASSLLLDHVLAGAPVRPAELSGLLRDAHPNIPERLLTPPIVGMLARTNNWSSCSKVRALPVDPNGREGGGVGGGGGGGGATWGDLQGIADVVDCFVAGSWDINVWGFSVCVDRECALRIAAALENTAFFFLLGKGGGDIPFAWLLLAAKIGGPIVAAVLLVLSLYSALLAWNIKWATTENGVCLGANWPTPILGSFVFAYSR